MVELLLHAIGTPTLALLALRTTRLASTMTNLALSAAVVCVLKVYSSGTVFTTAALLVAP
jgi:hypothetical protein